ncbi:hypothetical protein At15955_50300 (plasmid) [Agrobacterium tumefaciens]|nr:iron ABC transporter permease [Agrobacterium tumefaciens]AYM20015.1 hypothetical protein At15955_50300 [Agrobacterium tumefaciens]CUX06445.1 Uncharacterized ABC transporter permease protein YclN [Agrobacterium fabacearum TT111]AYM71318.1 hypothetical protein AtA6_51020 [Agrobacterium tumefaciens]NIB59707.1 iron chelate uptake ABC transporter family permease subunit [Agrobacterium tumefaciens]
MSSAAIFNGFPAVSNRVALLLAVCGVGLLALLSVLAGANMLSLAALLRGDSLTSNILLASRIPRTAALVLAGSSMAVAGMIMQMLARNRFVEPGTAGTIESASLGLLLVTLIGPDLSIFMKMLAATVGALAGTGLFLAILRRAPQGSTLVMPLVGLMLGGVVGAAATFIAYRYDMLQSLLAWSMGDFSIVMRGRYELLWISLGLTATAYLAADRLTVAGIGKSFSANLGVSYRSAMTIGLVIVAMTTATVVVTVGALPFVGLVIPNFVSLIVGDHVRKGLPWIAVLGAGFVLACDIFGRIIDQPYEIPIGPIISVVGGVVFLALLKYRSPRLG